MRRFRWKRGKATAGSAEMKAGHGGIQGAEAARSGRWERRVLTECARRWECSAIGATGAGTARTAQKRPLRTKPKRAMGAPCPDGACAALGCSVIGATGAGTARTAQKRPLRTKPRRAMGAPCPDGACAALGDVQPTTRPAYGQREPRKNARCGQNRSGRWERRVLTERVRLWDAPSSARPAHGQREPRKKRPLRTKPKRAMGRYALMSM